MMTRTPSPEKLAELEARMVKLRLYNTEPEKRYNGDGPIDSNIIEGVAALNALGIMTTASCGGHIDKFLSFPMLQGILVDREKDSVQRAKVIALLDEFNIGRDEQFALNLNKITPQGFRIESAITETGDDESTQLFYGMSEEHQKLMGGFVPFLEPMGRGRVAELVGRSQQEFIDFTEFLKQKYFAS